MTLYFASVLPGLESVLSKEIQVKISDAEIVQYKRGKVFFTSDQSLSRLKTLRSADHHLFQWLDQFQIGPHKKHLSDLTERMSNLDLSAFDHAQSFRVNASEKENTHTAVLNLRKQRWQDSKKVSEMENRNSSKLSNGILTRY